RIDDAADELLDAVLTLGRSDLPAEIFRDDDVRRLLRPEFGNLDVALLEHQLTALVADERRAELPFHLVERIDTRFGEKSGERQPGRCSSRLGLRARLIDTRSHRNGGAPAALHWLLAGTCRLVRSAMF